MKKKYYLGLDIGGTKVEGAIGILDKSTHSITVLAKKRIPCIQEINQFTESLVELIKSLLSDSALMISDLSAIGLGIPGSIDPKTQVMLNGNTKFLIGFDLISDLENKLKTIIPIVAQNDANLFTLAESWGGAGKHFTASKGVAYNEQIVVGITLGTGVGGGCVTHGKIFQGANGSALEVGHIVLESGGIKCYCGQQGCAETYLSGTAINKKMNSRELFEKAESGDPEVLQTLIDYRLNLVHFMSIINNLFNPHYFVFGGGLSQQQVLFEDIKTDLQENIFLSKEYCPEIYINQLGDSAGVYGAMIYASEII